MSLKEIIKSNISPRHLIRVLALKGYLFGEPEIKIIKHLVDSSKESIDVGAANGIYTYYLSQISSHVYSYEPNPLFYEFIQQWAFKNITVSSLALSDRKGLSILSIPIIDNKEFNKEGSLNKVIKGHFKKVEVSTITLDEMKHSNIGFIKIDAEGHEENVLKGSIDLLNKCHPNLLIEIEQRHHDNDIYETFSMIEHLGYKGYFLLKGKLTNIREFSLEEHQLKYLTNVDSASYINNFIFISKKKQLISISCSLKASVQQWKRNSRFMKRILFYSDVAAFGGHEVETLAAVRYLCQQSTLDVGFIYYEGNKRLSSRLLAIKEAGGRISLYPIRYYGKRLQSFRTLVSMRIINELKELFNKIKPDLVIIASGNIETCTLGLVAAKKAGYKTVSYIAVAHEVAVMGNKYGAKIRDMLNYYYYQLPDYYITISNIVKADLTKRGVSNKIAVVYNGIDLTKYSLAERDLCRVGFASGHFRYLVGCVGRILFRHKAQDLLVESLAKHKHRLKDVRLIIVGDGPDLARLKDMVSVFRLSDAVAFVDWRDDLSKIYSALDMLIIPSWFEGVPLVMLEAMYYGIPIVASNIDGMAEILPQKWLFKVGDRDSLVETFLAVKNADNSEAIRKNQLLVEQKYNFEEFGAKFFKAINEGA